MKFFKWSTWHHLMVGWQSSLRQGTQGNRNHITTSLKGTHYAYVLSTLQINKIYDLFFIFHLKLFSFYGAKVCIFSKFLIFMNNTWVYSYPNVKMLWNVCCSHYVHNLYRWHEFVCYKYLFFKVSVKMLDKLEVLTTLKSIVF